jgi:uncharacterized BrkB/YihY/UPF0761 family membrane protein
MKGGPMQTIYRSNAALLMTLAIVYLGSLAYLAHYLRRVHTALWIELGSPRFSPSWAHDNRLEFLRSFWNVLRFIFSDRYKSLPDQQIPSLIWLIRGSFLLTIGLFILQIFIGLKLRH